MRISGWSSDVCSSDLPARMLIYVTDGASVDLRWVIAIALAYIALRVAEGWGLWAGRAWAVVVGLASVALYLPVERWHLWHSPELVGVVLLTINPIGSASSRDRVCKNVSSSVVAVSLKNNEASNSHTINNH